MIITAAFQRGGAFISFIPSSHCVPPVLLRPPFGRLICLFRVLTRTGYTPVRYQFDGRHFFILVCHMCPKVPPTYPAGFGIGFSDVSPMADIHWLAPRAPVTGVPFGALPATHQPHPSSILQLPPLRRECVSLTPRAGFAPRTSLDITSWDRPSSPDPILPVKPLNLTCRVPGWHIPDPRSR